jgi:hypothetical protein
MVFLALSLLGAFETLPPYLTVFVYYVVLRNRPLCNTTHDTPQSPDSRLGAWIQGRDGQR